MGASDAGRAGPRLPDFIAVGPPRTATTWLHEVLKGHVGLPEGIKETDFFSRHYARGIDWYADYFRACPPGLKIGELCATYFASPEAPARIAKDLPRCRILCTFRDPVDRAYSFYRLLRRHAWTRVGFEEAVHKHREIGEQSRYAFHLQRWFDMFGRDAVMAALYDDLEADAQAFVDRVCEFIAIKRIEVKATQAAQRVHVVESAPPSRRLVRQARKLLQFLHSRRMHSTALKLRWSALGRFIYEGGKPFEPLAADVEERVRALFAPEVDALEKLIGRDLSAWKQHPTKLPASARPAPAAPRVA
jgi:Sulfotransferase domain